MSELFTDLLRSPSAAVWRPWLRWLSLWPSMSVVRHRKCQDKAKTNFQWSLLNMMTIRKRIWLVFLNRPQACTYANSFKQIFIEKLSFFDLSPVLCLRWRKVYCVWGSEKTAVANVNALWKATEIFHMAIFSLKLLMCWSCSHFDLNYVFPSYNEVCLNETVHSVLSSSF